MWKSVNPCHITKFRVGLVSFEVQREDYPLVIMITGGLVHIRILGWFVCIQTRHAWFKPGIATPIPSIAREELTEIANALTMIFESYCIQFTSFQLLQLICSSLVQRVLLRIRKRI